LVSVHKERGFTLIEVLVSVFVFMIVALSVYQSIASIYAVTETTDAKVVAAALAGEQLEIIRNLPYSSVGEVGGLPSGVVPRTQTIIRGGFSFTLTTTIRSVDDPFDGTFPTDTTPDDYKSVQIDMTCAKCKNFVPLKFNSSVGPKALETPSTAGALFIQAIDANGNPVPQANVHIVDSSASPSITIDDTTNNSGLLQVVNAPPGTNAYQVTVSKPGYSTEMTYAPGGSGNPNPVKPNPTVVVQQVTQLSFAIDKVSSLNVSSVDSMCGAVPSMPFTIAGAKIIGTPDVLKYSISTSTDASGNLSLSSLEWDTYNATETSPTYDLVGSIPLLPLNISPGSSQGLKLVFLPAAPLSLMVTVQDSATGLPLSGVSVTLSDSGTTTSQTTGRGYMSQSSWTGGGGQAAMTDPTKYLSATNMDTTSATNGMMLQNVFGSYVASSTLVSSTFDTGGPSNFYQISWAPSTQPAQVGASSTLFQIATNNDNATWNFVGPDGTANTFYDGGSGSISPVHDNTEFLRYKAYLQTSNAAYTPNVSGISITFTSSCTPLGQVLFQGMPSGTYTMTVSKAGYLTYTGSVSLASNWQQVSVPLIAQ